MDSVVSQQQGAVNFVVTGQKSKEMEGAAADVSMVDPFLVEALQTPRHRLTILRMELDIQNFMQNTDLQQFEFQHFPTSYLRLAAHRVAQHYGLQTMVQDNVLDGQGIRILVRKKPETKYPAICLSDIPAKQSENEKHEQIKIVLRQRPKASSSDNSELGLKHSSVRTVEERKEEYDRARARIFNSPGSSESEDTLAPTACDRKEPCLNANENEGVKNSIVDFEKNIGSSDNGASSRVAIFRDREKDRTDPDYDRSYERYIKNIPATQSFSLTPFNVQPFQTPFLQYDSGFCQLNQMPRAQTSLNHRNQVMSPFCALGSNQTSRDAVHVQWPIHSMMYAQSYDQLRHAVFQAPVCQQPLSFDYSQNHS